MKKLNFERAIFQYEQYLISEEKSPATIEKYLRDIRSFVDIFPGNLTRGIAKLRVLC